MFKSLIIPIFETTKLQIFMKKQSITTTLILFFALSLSLSSCCAPCSKSAPKIGELEQGTWRLIELQLNPIEASEITMTFNAEEKTMYGTAACNNFFSGYTLYNVKGNKRNIKFANIGSTRKMCPDMEQEETFVRLLPGVERVKIEGDNLLLIDTLKNMVAIMRKEVK